MKIEEIDAINFKNDEAHEAKEKVVKDETITLTINNDISLMYFDTIVLTYAE